MPTLKSEVSSELDVNIPAIQEELRIDVQKNVTGIVRVEKLTHDYEEVVSQDLVSESIYIERVPVNRHITEPPAVRYEGNTMIVPVVEEILVTTKQLVLKEEVRIQRRRTQSRHEETVQLRSEEVEVTRITPDGSIEKIGTASPDR